MEGGTVRCAKCGSVAHNDGAGYCAGCGSALPGRARPLRPHRLSRWQRLSVTLIVLAGLLVVGLVVSGRVWRGKTRLSAAKTPTSSVPADKTSDREATASASQSRVLPESKRVCNEANAFPGYVFTNGNRIVLLQYSDVGGSISGSLQQADNPDSIGAGPLVSDSVVTGRQTGLQFNLTFESQGRSVQGVTGSLRGDRLELAVRAADGTMDVHEYIPSCLALYNLLVGQMRDVFTKDADLSSKILTLQDNASRLGGFAEYGPPADLVDDLRNAKQQANDYRPNRTPGGRAAYTCFYLRSFGASHIQNRVDQWRDVPQLAAHVNGSIAAVRSALTTLTSALRQAVWPPTLLDPQSRADKAIADATPKMQAGQLAKGEFLRYVKQVLPEVHALLDGARNDAPQDCDIVLGDAVVESNSDAISEVQKAHD